MKHDRSSDTAKFVLNGIYWVSQHPHLKSEVPGGLSRYTSEMTRCVEWSENPVGSWFQRRRTLWKAGLMQAISIPGIYLYQMLRKRFIESIARSEVLPSVSQLVVFGAGFDTLSLRVSASHPGMTVIEVDHPASQAAKIEALEGFNMSTGRCTFVESDLEKDGVEEGLARCPDYDPKAPTLFVAEGLTMYLSESRVRELLNYVAGGSPDFRLLFTYMEEMSTGRWDFREQRSLATKWLAFRNERFTWGASPEALRDLLAESELAIVAHRTAEDLRLEFLDAKNRDARLAHGENTVLVAPVR